MGYSMTVIGTHKIHTITSRHSFKHTMYTQILFITYVDIGGYFGTTMNPGSYGNSDSLSPSDLL